MKNGRDNSRRENRAFQKYISELIRSALQFGMKHNILCDIWASKYVCGPLVTTKLKDLNF